MTNNRIFFAVLLIFFPLLLAAADWPVVLNEFEKEGRGCIIKTIVLPIND